MPYDHPEYKVPLLRIPLLGLGEIHMDAPLTPSSRYQDLYEQYISLAETFIAVIQKNALSDKDLKVTLPQEDGWWG